MKICFRSGEKLTSHAEPAVPSAAVPGDHRYLHHWDPGSCARAFRVDVDPILAAITRIHEPVIAQVDAMRMAAIAGGELTETRADPAHLTLVHTVLVEDDHPVVAVAVGDIDLAIRRIHRDVRRIVQESLAETLIAGVSTSTACKRPRWRS